MKKTAFIASLGGAFALSLAACAPEAAEGDATEMAEEDMMSAPEASAELVDERDEECENPNEDGSCDDPGDDGDRTTPGAPTGTDDRREMQQ